MAHPPSLSLNSWLRSGWINRGLRGLSPDTEVLEIGAGQGAFGVRLAKRFRYLGIESDAISGAMAHERVTAAGGDLLIGAAEQTVGDRRFDALVAFEVLEHLEDDLTALRGWVGWLRPGGRLVVSVPSDPRRFGPWDEAVGHYRRYTREQVRSLLEDAGFESISVWSYGWPLGYLLESVRDRLARHQMRTDGSMDARTAGSGRSFQPADVLGPGTWLATLPFRALQWPFSRTRLGTGLVAAARWPGSN